MISCAPIKPTHKTILAYYEKLQGYGAHDVTHEMGLRSAFQQLLEETGRVHKWTLIPEQSMKVGGKSVRPDGTFRDEWHLPAGYWEARDTADDLNAEIRAKIAKGYALVNTIFEDTREAVLFDDGREVFRVLLSSKPANRGHGTATEEIAVSASISDIPSSSRASRSPPSTSHG
jgi:hypothetical protein